MTPRAFLARSGWFDEEWYAARADVPERVDPLEHYLEHGAPTGLAPSAWLADVQDPRPDRVTPSSARPETVPPEWDQQLRLEIELVRESDLFDEAFYRWQLDAMQVQLRGVEPVVHFCQRGWRNALKPSAGFDTWWYWSNHLDPQREAVNPLVHHLVLGRAAGLTPTAGLGTSRPPQGLPTDRPPRRVVLFAGYDAQGIVDEYVVDYVAELSRHADVYYLCDGHLEPGELDKLGEHSVGAWAIRHGAYDFGSYSMLAKELVGWDELATYDEVLLVNDSCYLLRDLDEVFARMDRLDVDWWGLQATKGVSATSDAPTTAFTEPIPLDRVRRELLPVYERDAIYDFHVGSYFLAYRSAVIADQHFRRLLDSVHGQRGKLAVIFKYEVGLTRWLVGNGYSFDTFIDTLYPFHPVFTRWYFELLDRGFPLLKKLLLYRNHYEVPDLAGWKERVLAVAPDAKVEVMERNLVRTAPDDELRRSLAITTRPDGTVDAPPRLQGPAMRRRDTELPKREDSWAFVVNGDDVLARNARAIFEHVREDESLTKVVLTRGRRLGLTGPGVVEVPLDSPEGEDHLMRSRHVLVEDRPHKAIEPKRLDWTRHQLVVVRGGHELERVGHASPDLEAVARRRVRPIVTGLLTGSDLDALATLSMHHTAVFDACWRTGLPATDLVLMPYAALPDPLREQEDRVRARLDGRRLVLIAPQTETVLTNREPTFSLAELDRLSAWARHEDVVLGLRDDADRRPWLRQLGDRVLDLSARHVPDVDVLLRVADAVVTDFSGLALDFLATGRPVVSFVHDLERVGPHLFHDLDHVLPEPPALDFEDLVARLETLLGPRDAAYAHRYARAQKLFFDHLDDQSAARAVAAIRTGAQVVAS